MTPTPCETCGSTNTTTVIEPMGARVGGAADTVTIECHNPDCPLNAPNPRKGDRP